MKTFGVVVIGASTGGLKACQTLLRGLAPDFSVPIVIVQHRREDEGSYLARLLGKSCRLPVREVEDKDLIEPAFVYLAPSNYHLLVDQGSFSLSVDERVCFARPSVDVLFETCASIYGSAAIGVILTGASHDGAQGLAAIAACGGLTVVQEPGDAEARQAPEAALGAVTVDHVLPLAKIPELLNRLTGCDDFAGAG